MTSVNVKWVGGQTLTSSFTVTDPLPPNPYPVVTLASLQASPSEMLNVSVAKLTTKSVVKLPAGTIWFNGDFRMGAGNYGIFAPNLMGFDGTVDAAGNNLSIVRPVANQSTFTNPTSGVNGKWLVRFDGASWNRNWILRGTPQNTSLYGPLGHNYNGLVWYHDLNSVTIHVGMEEIPGSGGSPPDESFNASHYAGTGGRVWNSWTDRGTISNSASGWATNSGQTNVTYINCRANGMLQGAGWAFSTGSGMTLIDCAGTNNKRDVNFENMTGALNVTRFNFTSGMPVCITNATGSAVLTIPDWIASSGWLTVRVYTKGVGGVGDNQQRSPAGTGPVRGITSNKLLNFTT